MQPPVSITFLLILILASDRLNSEGLKWDVHVEPKYHKPPGSNVRIFCNFTYPEKYHTRDVQVYWKKPGRSVCSEHEKDKEAFVFHTNKTCVHDDYKGRTTLIGRPANGDCSLLIQNVTKNEPMIYLRVSASNQNYSFFNKFVSISVNGKAAVTSGPDMMHLTLFTTEASESNEDKATYAAIAVPVVVVVLVAAAILLAVKHKRSKSVTRKESGYYANFSRASSDTPQRLSLGTKVEQTQTGPKTIDEPVYANLETPSIETHQGTDHSDHVYGNVDYLK